MTTEDYRKEKRRRYMRQYMQLYREKNGEKINRRLREKRKNGIKVVYDIGENAVPGINF